MERTGFCLPVGMRYSLKYAALLAIAGMIAPGELVAQDSLREPATPPHWEQLSDSAGHVVGLREDQAAGWRQRNEKWNKEYEALGKDPEKKPEYIKLHSAREFDLKRFLSGDQYDRWRELNHRSWKLFPANPPGTNMPPDR